MTCRNNKDKNMQNLIYGRNSVLSFLNTGKIKKIIFQNNFDDKRFFDLLKKESIETEYASLLELNKIANSSKHQGVVAIVKDFNYTSLQDLINYSKTKKNPLIVLIDGVNDPHNLGAILRSCDAFSADGIILKNHHQVLINATVAKVSTGAVNYVKAACVPNLNNAIKTLKDNGFWIYSADGEASQLYDEVCYDRPVALILGSEGEGISPLLIKNSDFVIKIPMTGHVNSLNVSVSTGILLANIRNKQSL